MGKHESPPFKMLIENGKLVPATAYDQERLDTYRNRTKVNVVMVRDGGRVMERKWFAVLGLVVKQCNVPWKNKDQASEAVKLALGIVNLTKTVGGEFMAYPKSLTELSDPEIDEAVRDMMDLIQRMTGIDPATLKKEIADVGEDEQEPQSGAPTSEGSDGDAPRPNTPDVAATPIEPAAADQEAGEPEADHGDSAAPASDLPALKRECISKFLTAATDPSVPEAKDRQETVVLAKDAWKQSLPNEPDFVRACFETARKVVRGELKEAPARKYLESLL
jgi:hypothetical protein